MTLNEHQRNALDAVAILTAQRGFPPTLVEVGVFVGRPTSTVAYTILTLTRAGLLMHVDGIPRSLMVTEQGRPHLSPVRRIT